MMQVSIVLVGPVKPATARHFLSQARPSDEVVVIESTSAGSASWPDYPRLRRVPRDGNFGDVVLGAIQGDAALIVRFGDRLRPGALDALTEALDHDGVAAAGCSAFEKRTGRPLNPMRHVPLAVSINRPNVFDGEIAYHASLTSATEMVPSSTCLLVRRTALSPEALAGFDTDPATALVAGPIFLLRGALRHGRLALIPDGCVFVPHMTTEKVREIRGGPSTVAFWWNLLETEPGLSDLDLRRAYSSLLRRVSLLPILESSSDRVSWINFGNSRALRSTPRAQARRIPSAWAQAGTGAALHRRLPRLGDIRRQPRERLDGCHRRAIRRPPPSARRWQWSSPSVQSGQRGKSGERSGHHSVASGPDGDCYTGTGRVPRVRRARGDAEVGADGDRSVSKTPLVSICIPVYNRRRMLLEGLESARNQTWENIEIIVGDNASTDGTAEAAVEVARQDERIKVLTSSENVIGLNYNRVVSAARGEFIKILNSDDLLYPQAIERLVQALEPGVTLSFGKADYITVTGEYASPRTFETWLDLEGDQRLSGTRLRPEDARNSVQPDRRADIHPLSSRAPRSEIANRLCGTDLEVPQRLGHVAPSPRTGRCWLCR